MDHLIVEHLREAAAAIAEAINLMPADAKHSERNRLTVASDLVDLVLEPEVTIAAAATPGPEVLPDTAEELLKKFPKMEHCDALPESCMLDIACPKCGQREAVEVHCMVWATLREDGTELDTQDASYEPRSACKCPVCEHEAELLDFTFLGLDKLIDARPVVYGPKQIKPGTVLRSYNPKWGDYTVEVLSRSGTFVTVKVEGNTRRFKIEQDKDGCEFILAMGRHSQAPVFHAAP